MAKSEPPIVKRSLFSWIFAGNLKYQILLLIVIIVMVGARVLPLEMQKRVINEAVKLRNLDLLLMYCGIYLAAVVFFSLLKYVTNVIQTLISQRTTARMRKALYHHILTLPLNFFRKTQPGTVVNALTNELTLPGNFVGMAVASPVTNLLTLLAFAVYLFWLNPLLAAVSLSIYPIVVFLIPLLQRGVNKANKKRVDAARKFSARIAESISGVHEIHGNGAYDIENRKYDSLVDRLLKIRIVWSLYRFAVKTANGFFTSLGPFLVFVLGGYLTIKGQLELGALVAFLSAQERLFEPWRELIEFYQVYQDGKINYTRTMEYFDVEPEHALKPKDREPMQLAGDVEVRDLSFVTNTGIRLLDGINISLTEGEHLALVGFSGSGKSTLAMCIGQLYKYTGGSVLIGNQEVSDLTKKDMVNNIGFVAQSPFIFDGTIEENILYSSLAKLDGNGRGGEEQRPSLDDVIAVLHQTGIFVDVLRFGLNAILTHEKNEALVNTIVKVRKNFQRDYGEDLADYVEFFNENKYLYYSSVAENLTFGAPNKSDFSDENLSRNNYFLRFLKTADLTRPLLSLGVTLCRQTVDILGNLPPDAVFFEQSPINADELDDFKVLVEHLKRKKLHELEDGDHRKLLELALRFTPGVHKMAALPEILETLILEGRALFRENISKDDPEAFTFIQMSEYIYSQTILNNIFFGKTKTGNPQAQERINQSIIQLLIEEDLLETIIEIGMHYQVGTKGDKLSGGQQQKLAIARVFLKEPKILIMDEATSALDNRSQARIQNLLETRWKKKSTVVSVVHRLDTIKNFDKVAVMKAGKILEMGTYDELMARKGMLYELVGKK
ncbi:MAG: ABC transporter ATP-binding protein/permease [Deltaproteobacteria bacterium]|jgi:ABC-type multidrug transport system fused ATPase/permease subunit|nr:ABC transporter ATP-binding protein/permease [Deltaproteobacteria bacterium]